MGGSTRSLLHGAFWAILLCVACIAAGAAATITPFAIAGLLVILLVVGTLAFPDSAWRFLALAAIVVSPQVFAPDDNHPIPNSDAAQKAVLILGLICLLVTLGARWSWIGGTALTALGLSSLLALLKIGGMIEVGPSPVLRAAIGFALPWCFLMVDWRKLDLRRGLRFIAYLPIVSLAGGVVLQLLGISPMLSREQDGALRLQDTAIPAHLAMIALVGMTAALFELTLDRTGPAKGAPLVHRVPAFALVIIDLVVLLGTSTRSPIAVGAAVLAVFVVRAAWARSDLGGRARRGAMAIVGAAAVALIATVPELILRSQGNSYEGKFNTSGRDQAWNFFLDVGSASPLTGRGLGFSPLAVELLKPVGVQTAFIAPHNEYIHFYVDGGILFATAVLGCFAAVFVAAARSQTGTARWLVIVLGIGTAFYSYTDNTLSTPQYPILVFMMLGLLISHPASRSESDDSPPQPAEVSPKEPARSPDIG